MNIEREIEAIKERNRKVELDKAWEISWARRGFILIVTYGIAGIWLVLIHDASPWLKALVPAGGYLLSTLSVPIVRRMWEKTLG